MLEATGDFTEGDLLIDCMDKLIDELEYSGQGETVFVKSISGIANDSQAGRYWIYMVNDELSKVGCGTYRIKQGDQVKWIYRPSPYEENQDPSPVENK